MRQHRHTGVAQKAFGAATLQRTQSRGYRAGFTLAKQRERFSAFTLAELLVTVGVLVVLVFLASQLLNSAATVTTLGHKQMDADSQTRQLLDRMAVDFAQMIKRADVDYYLKSSATPPPVGVRNVLFRGNDKIAFYSAVPGYYPSSGSQSPVSLVSYRINLQNKLERMGKGLVWNAVSSADTPVVFMPIPMASALPIAELPYPSPNPTLSPAWQNVADPALAPTPDPSTEVIGPQVFRFEYYYLLKGQPPNPVNPEATPYPAILSDIPWDWRICACPTATPGASATPSATSTPTPTAIPSATPAPTPLPTPQPAVCCHVAPEGMQDVAAVVVVIAVIDPRSRALVTDENFARLNGTTGSPPILVDYNPATMTTPGQLLAQWRTAINANAAGLVPQAISGIRVYERYLYLSPPTLLTP